MGRRKDKTKTYEQLQPEELHAHIRKNISIPKYMDAFLYKQNISLSKLVQSAIIQRMEEQQKEFLKKDVKKELQQQSIKKHLSQKQKKNPQFTHELQRARQILTKYFNAFDNQDNETAEKHKQQMLKDFPEMYVDILKFERWESKHKQYYFTIRTQYDNVVERLVKIKKQYL